MFCGQGPNFLEMQLPYTFRTDLDSMSLRALSIFIISENHGTNGDASIQGAESLKQHPLSGCITPAAAQKFYI